MKKSKFYIFLIILTAIALFSFAAICNQCTLTPADEDEMEEETDADETSDDNGTDNAAAADDDLSDEDPPADDDTPADDSGPEEAPGMALEVYEGPVYVEDGDICYWRVRALVEGNPNPTITWSRDNSNGSFGNKKAQVNLERGETYTLEATATNSEGSVTETIILEWGCDGPPAEDPPDEEDLTDEDPPAEDPGPEEASISADPAISGDIWDHGVIQQELYAHIGDNRTGSFSKGYFSFDISGLHGKTVQDAEINFTNISRRGEPSSFASEIVVKVYNYVRLDASDFEVGGTYLASIPISSTSYTITGDTLKSELQAVLDNSVRDYFQLKLGLNVSTDNDGITEGIQINWNEAVLYISYTD